MGAWNWEYIERRHIRIGTCRLHHHHHHHPQQKKSVIQALFQRAERICDKENLRKEERFLADVLQKNGYTMRDIRQEQKYYVCQTGRNIECRIKEHERDVRLRKIQQSAVAEHCHKGGHSIEFEKTKVLARNGHYFQRLTREGIEIHRHGNNMNRDDGWELSRT
ncbi:uncharacterized protein [Onthophagus taurus]|uniref:uncharacterized protein n=1 Tax=Onthophagus taurus TaxID=166361 RepID=UPI0039BEC3C3